MALLQEARTISGPIDPDLVPSRADYGVVHRSLRTDEDGNVLVNGQSAERYAINTASANWSALLKAGAPEMFISVMRHLEPYNYAETLTRLFAIPDVGWTLVVDYNKQHAANAGGILPWLVPGTMLLGGPTLRTLLLTYTGRPRDMAYVVMGQRNYGPVQGGVEVVDHGSTDRIADLQDDWGLQHLTGIYWSGLPDVFKSAWTAEHEEDGKDWIIEVPVGGSTPERNPLAPERKWPTFIVAAFTGVIALFLGK